MYSAFRRVAADAALPLRVPTPDQLTSALIVALACRDTLPPLKAMRTMRELRNGTGVYATRVYLVIGALLAAHTAGEPLDPIGSETGLTDFEVDVAKATLAACGVAVPDRAVSARVPAPAPRTSATSGGPDAPPAIGGSEPSAWRAVMRRRRACIRA